jgi:hypothetical protein
MRRIVTWRSWPAATALVGLLGGLDACTRAPARPGPATLETREERLRASAEVLYAGDSTRVVYRARNTGFVDAARLVVRDSATWRAVWARLLARGDPRRAPPPADTPVIDFERELVVVLAQGLQGDCSEGIAVDSVYRVGQGPDVVVVVRQRAVLGPCGCLTDLREPAFAVRVQHERVAELRLRFEERPLENVCRARPR